MDLSVVCPPHGVAVVDADVLSLLDVHCCSDHNPDVGRLKSVNIDEQETEI